MYFGDTSKTPIRLIKDLATVHMKKFKYLTAQQMQIKRPPSDILHAVLFWIYIVFVVALEQERAAEISCSQHYTSLPTVLVLVLVYLPVVGKS